MDYTHVISQSATKLKIELYQNQLSLIYQMEKLESEQLVEKENGFRKTLIGINAEKSGYGKTLGMVGLVARDKMVWDLEVPFVHEIIESFSANLIQNVTIKRFDKIKCTLILVHSSMINLWKKEFEYTNLSIATIISSKELEKIKITDHDVVLVNTTMYNSLLNIYPKFAWKRFIYDEPGVFKVTNMREIRAGFYWLVSSDPQELMICKHRKRTRNFMDEIMPYCQEVTEQLFTGMIIKNKEEYLSSLNLIPSITNNTYEYFPLITSDNKVYNEMSKLINTGKIEDAVLLVGGKVTNNIIEFLNDKEKTKTKILTEKFTNIFTANCTICYDTVKFPIIDINCENVFCVECLVKWLVNSSTCPLCRIKLNPEKDLVYIRCETTPLIRISRHERAFEIINKNKLGKFLVYINFDGSEYKFLLDLLNVNKINYINIYGFPSVRNKVIKEFKSSLHTRVMLFNSNTQLYKIASIEFQEITDIIIYNEDIPKDYQNVFISRAQRIDRKVPLNVHYLKAHI